MIVFAFVTSNSFKFSINYKVSFLVDEYPILVCPEYHGDNLAVVLR